MKVDNIAQSPAMQAMKEHLADKAAPKRTEARDPSPGAQKAALPAQEGGEPREIFTHKAVFAVDGDKNVVIRIIDKEGKVVEQIPAHEYIQTVKQLRQAQNLIDKKA